MTGRRMCWSAVIALVVGGIFCFLPRLPAYRSDRTLGWPVRSVELVPALMYVPSIPPVSYQTQLAVMDQVWNQIPEFVGPNWAVDRLAPSWRWLRLPSGHVLQFSVKGLLLDFFCGSLLTAALLVGSMVRTRASRMRRGLCIRCGYNLTGNDSGVFPECGLRVLRPFKGGGRTTSANVRAESRSVPHG